MKSRVFTITLIPFYYNSLIKVARKFEKLKNIFKKMLEAPLLTKDADFGTAEGTTSATAWNQRISQGRADCPF